VPTIITGVASDETVSVKWVPTIADVNAPKLATEINAATSVTLECLLTETFSPDASVEVGEVVLALVIVVLARYIMKLQDSRHEATLGHATLMKEMAKEHARELAAANEQHLAEIRAAHAEVVAKLDSLAACGTALSGAAEAMESAVDAMDHAKATFRESLTPLSNPAPSGRGQGKRNT
jgi:hypothetical protein